MNKLNKHNGPLWVVLGGTGVNGLISLVYGEVNYSKLGSGVEICVKDI